ncbi:HlyD family efflux transporter periplasmic adaptor subunit [Mixta sp. Marseille-Q2659]|uniref:HlyD family secretion protein n=1 Tax=Mixta sp. Marseille-Q2659 TaxID=2736607 RepID=UPI0023B9BF2C|nr:HlyD family efflux transporter periplasmic adaptor subunit [Mixta sp. Marseille-Q2659]
MSKDDKESAGKPKGKALLIFPLAVFICIGVYAAFVYMGKNDVTTEDAYVEGNIVPVSSQISGTVVKINADNTDYVKQGDVLVGINQTDSRIALDKASAQLASSIRSVRNQFATVEELKAAIAVKQSDYNQALGDFKRRSGLSRKYVISEEDMSHSSDAVNSAKAALQVAQRQYQAELTLTDNTTPDTHPDVLTAKAALRSAYIDYHRTKVVAPVSGFIAQRTVQVGQHLSAGSSLMSVIPLDDVWVTANFKETQMGQLRTDQPVTLVSDAYGGKITYHGKVMGVEPGTGSAFSLLPASNATGNWIKVVQRVPVRIELDKKEVEKYPLRPGLSMKVSVNVTNAGDESLHTLKDKPRQSWHTPVYDDEEQAADNLIKEIVAQNE